ncbi:MAG: zf-HC2 domain-containing protein [Peptococcaceae bacterium]
MKKECQLIQELFPLYLEELVSPETREYIEGHLAQCTFCQETWEQLKRPLPEILPVEEVGLEKAKGAEERILTKLKKTMLLVISIFVVGGLGIAYASYNAGKHIGLDDPSYRIVDELGLFTQINQTKILDNSEITLQKGIFDSSRTILFLTVANPEDQLLEIHLRDQEGNEYFNKSSKIFQKKYYVAEFDPLNIAAEEVKATLRYQNGAEDIEFLFPVDIAATLQHTRIIYPNLKQKTADINIAMQKIVLGISQSEFKIKMDWPYDGSVSGIAVGKDAYFPTSYTKLPDHAPPAPGPVGPEGLIANYAATYGINYRSEDPPVVRPVLYDLTQRQEITIQQGEYRTTQFPSQVEGSVKFDPVEAQTEELEFVLPPIYVFHKIPDAPQISLDFTEQTAIDKEHVIPFDKGLLKISRAWLEKERVFIKYQVEIAGDGKDIIPHFILSDEKGQGQGRMNFSWGEEDEIFFSLPEQSDKYTLKLESTGQLLPRQKFAVTVSEE